MTEEEKTQSFHKWMVCKNPGISSALKMREFIENWIAYKIDMLPMLDSPKDKMNQEFNYLIAENFELKDGYEDKSKQ